MVGFLLLVQFVLQQFSAAAQLLSFNFTLHAPTQLYSVLFTLSRSTAPHCTGYHRHSNRRTRAIFSSSAFRSRSLRELSSRRRSTSFAWALVVASCPRTVACQSWASASSDCTACQSWTTNTHRVGERWAAPCGRTQAVQGRLHSLVPLAVRRSPRSAPSGARPALHAAVLTSRSPGCRQA